MKEQKTPKEKNVSELKIDEDLKKLMEENPGVEFEVYTGDEDPKELGYEEMSLEEFKENYIVTEDNDEENPTGFHAQVNAKIMLMMGKNAVRMMKTDRFMMNFIPSVTASSMAKAVPEEVLKKYNLTDINNVEYPEDYFDRIMQNDTRLLSKVADASFEEKYGEWSKEIEVMLSIRAIAHEAIELVKSYVDFSSSRKETSPPYEKASVYEEIKTADRKIDEYTDKIKKAYSTYIKKKDLTPEEKLNLIEEIKRFKRERWDYTVTKNALQARLVAEGCFDFTSEMKKEDIDNNTRQHYIDQFIESSKANMDKLGEQYMQKYGMVPPPVMACADILKCMHSLMYDFNPNLDYVNNIYLTKINTYTDLLFEGPNMIIQIANMFPAMVMEFNRDMLLYRNKPEDYMLVIKQHTDQDDYYKDDNNILTIGMTNILGNSKMAPSEESLYLGFLPAISILGPSGIGKTTSIESFAKKIDCRCLYVSVPANEKEQVLLRQLGSMQPSTSQLSKTIVLDKADDKVNRLVVTSLDLPGIIIIDEATAPRGSDLTPQHTRFLRLARQFTRLRESSMNHYIHPLNTIVIIANDDILHNMGHVCLNNFLNCASFYRQDSNKLMAD